MSLKPTRRSTYRLSGSKLKPPRKTVRLDLSKYIAELAARTGWTQAEIADFLESTQPQVSRWRSGRGCAVPMIKPILMIATRTSAPLLRAVMRAIPPEDAWLALLQMVGGKSRAQTFTGVDDRLMLEWAGDEPRTLKRLATLMQLAAVFEPSALGDLLRPSDGATVAPVAPARPVEAVEKVEKPLTVEDAAPRSEHDEEALRGMMLRNLAYHREKEDKEQIAKCEAALERMGVAIPALSVKSKAPEVWTSEDGITVLIPEHIRYAPELVEAHTRSKSAFLRSQGLTTDVPDNQNLT